MPNNEINVLVNNINYNANNVQILSPNNEYGSSSFWKIDIRHNLD